MLYRYELEEGTGISLAELLTIMEVTAYTAGYESTQKRPGDPGYGITYSGTQVKQWRTVAAGPDIPLGTRLFIPELADKPNGGIFIVEDRGGAISNAHLDIYMDHLHEARSWGRQHLEVLLCVPRDEVEQVNKKIAHDRKYRWMDRAALRRLFP